VHAFLFLIIRVQKFVYKITEVHKGLKLYRPTCDEDSFSVEAIRDRAVDSATDVDSQADHADNDKDQQADKQ